MAEVTNSKRIAKKYSHVVFSPDFNNGSFSVYCQGCLKVLVEVDYGIYNVVAGVVTMFNFLSNFMMVLTGTGKYAYRREDGLYVVPVGCLKD